MEGFIKFYNSFMEDGDKKLTPIEYYFYCMLGARWSPFINAAEITISRITEVQSIYADRNKPARNKASVYSHLEKLEDRGLIHIAYDGELTCNGKTDYDKTLTITFTDVEGGFEQIKPSLYRKASTQYELYFLSVLYRFRDKGFERTIESLAELLGCNVKTAKELIRKLKENGYIDYGCSRIQNEHGRFSATPNKYFLVEASVKKEIPIKVVEEAANIVESKDGEKRKHIWYDRDTGFPDVDDYYVYLTTDDPKLKKHAEKRIKGLSSTDYGKKQVEKLLDEARLRILREERQEAQQEEEDKKEELLEQIKLSNKNYIKRENEHVELSDTDNLQPSDVLVWIREDQVKEYNINRTVERLEETNIHTILACHSLYDPRHFGWPKIKTETKDILFKRLKELLNQSLFDKSMWEIIDDIREQIFKRNNLGKSFDEEHEGDKFESYQEGSEENISLKERKYKHKNEQRALEEQKKQQEKNDKFADFFDWNEELSHS